MQIHVDEMEVIHLLDGGREIATAPINYIEDDGDGDPVELNFDQAA